MLFQGIYMPGAASAVQGLVGGAGGDSAVIPGKNVDPVPSGTVRPPVSGWGDPKANPQRKCR